MSYVNKIKKVKQTSIVTLLQAKQQLNVDESFLDDDENILFLIESATGAAEDYTGTDIALTENTLEFIDFNGKSITIREAPYKDIVSVTSTKNGVDTLVDASTYTVHEKLTDFTLLLDENIEADKLTIVFHTGYDRDDAPYQVINAILVKINDLYDMERTSYVSGANFKDNKTFSRLLNANVINRW